MFGRQFQSLFPGVQRQDAMTKFVVHDPDGMPDPFALEVETLPVRECEPPAAAPARLEGGNSLLGERIGNLRARSQQADTAKLPVTLRRTREKTRRKRGGMFQPTGLPVGPTKLIPLIFGKLDPAGGSNRASSGNHKHLGKVF